MGIAELELAVQRQLSKAFINADYLTVILERSVWVSDGSGGSVRQPPAPLAPQRMRLIPLGDGAQERFTASGEAVTPSYMLMAEHTADLERWDEFTLNGRRYEVVFLNENQQYEKKAEVAYRG